MVAAEVKKLAHDTRAATGEIAGTIASLTREAEAVTSEIKAGVDKSRVAKSTFSTINDTVRDVADIVALVDRQTDGIALSTSLIQASVDSVKSGLSSFAADARDNGGQLRETHDRLTKLELLSNEMLDRLASSGVRIDDTPFIESRKARPTRSATRSRPGSRAAKSAPTTCSTPIMSKCPAPIRSSSKCASATSPTPMSARSSTG